ncbi:type I-D CRISPR-associated protein Cas10d/Csc3 [Candidatus Poribacteria bacterium]|nr:type I-D CRISPR-associated protein Cas10d/Csc3 [Candidatus Poribacteria bacterium]MYG05334.1 type I-D CRISPR-associated protein Cas10d/Csc3 [Candidatus Poribacteria bacterium]MYK24019.1 type I-D CRISPR-associated protein Cas10d/Csc3 [Candidatus Poribacteria bacterium]
MVEQLEMFSQLDDSEENREVIPIPMQLAQLMDLEDDEAEVEEIFAHIALLKRAIPADDHVLQDYVEVVGPRMQKEYTLRSAKGSSVEKYARNDDQSMLAHILNGVFPTLQIVRESETDLSPIEKQLYLIAYTLHDLDKLVNVQGLSVAEDKKKSEFYGYLDDWVERLHLDKFCPEYDEYREDVGYLILNTQVKYGADLNPQNFDRQLPTDRHEFLKDMCRCSDLIAYFMKNPASFLERQDIRDSLTLLSRGKLVFSYHKVSENRGMLTNVINNAVLAEMRGNLGWKPFLFFPTGVTYLQNRDSQDSTLPIGEEIAEVVVEKLTEYCTSRLRQNLNGFTRGGKGFKYADYYDAFFEPHEMLELIQKGCFKILRQDKAPSAGKRLSKLQQLQTEGKIPEDISLDFEDDLRVDQLAEYLVEVEKLIGGFASRETVANEILSYLGMSNLRETFTSIPSQGGVPLPWYFIAGKYLLQNRGKDENDMRDLFEEIAGNVTKVFAETIRNQPRSDSFATLRDYVKQTVDINGHQNLHQNFQAELTRYTNTKKIGRGADKGCSLCSSAFQTQESSETDVIFAPQVFSHKTPINSGRVKRGICQLCKLEMMLRQILIRSRWNLIGAGYESVKIKWIYLYPSYFFTPETSGVIGKAYQNLKSLNFFDIRKKFHKGKAATDLIGLDEFIIDTEIPGTEKENLLKMDFSTNDLATFYFCGIPTLGTRPTDTESWAMPTLLGLLSTLAFNAKVVVTESQVPLYHSAEEFKETVVINAPHPFVTHILQKERLRIDEIEKSLEKLSAIYDINIDAFRDGAKPQWQHLNSVAGNIETDPLYVFHYLDVFRRKNKWDSFPKPKDGDIFIPERYLRFYETLGGDKMSLIEGIAQRCFNFYSPADRRVPHSVLRVVSLVEGVIINSESTVKQPDLKWQARGVIQDLMRRIRNGGAQGYFRLSEQEELKAIEALVDYFYEEVFKNDCGEQRAILRARRNLLNSGINAWYQVNWEQFRKEKNEETTDVNN